MDKGIFNILSCMSKKFSAARAQGPDRYPKGWVAGALRAPHWSASAQDLRIFFQSRKKNFGIQDFEKNLLRQNLMSPWGKVKIYAEVEILQYFKGNIKAIYGRIYGESQNLRRGRNSPVFQGQYKGNIWAYIWGKSKFTQRSKFSSISRAI